MYPFKEIEAKWQRHWVESGAHKIDTSYPEKHKYYCLVMFNYPSADRLHIGHWYNYGPTDSWARYKKMQGFQVFEPMGYDAFGLPAENYAIEKGIHPAHSTAENIRQIRRQLKAIGAMYDLRDKEIDTSSPQYYRWTQWLFLQLYKNGLAYRKKAPVNWCPGCHTVLANEQVVEGKCERCSSAVTKKDLVQWFFKITQYADRLLEGHNKIDWPEKTVLMQKNWIGKSQGVEISFFVEAVKKPIDVFTTRADTLFGVTYLVLAPEHSLVNELTALSRKKEVTAYIEEAKRETEIERTSTIREKTGVFTGSYATHPLSGEKIPIWIADYVLLSYGTGAVMAVPAHDSRDFEFAKKFDLPVKEVIIGEKTSNEQAYTEEGKMASSGPFNGLSSQDGRERIAEHLEKVGKGKRKINYKLRDWLISRQRYWGAPIPIVYCPSCGEVPVPEKDLPVLLPSEINLKETQGSGKSPLSSVPDFVNTLCPACGKEAHREVDTMDTFVCSSWYYLRFVNPHYEKGPFDPKAVQNWLPVDHYVGGAEHAVLHLLYARFITKVLYDLKLIHFDEPFMRLVHQGTITNKGAKMSKSRGNVVNPDALVGHYGSDVLRMHLMFTGPYEEGGDWNDKGINGISRFLDRIWKMANEDCQHQKVTTSPAELKRIKHRTIKRVTTDMEKFHFNTAISALMEYVSYLQKERQQIAPQDWEEGMKLLFLLLAPFAPHLGEELWRIAGKDRSIFNERWPSYEESALVEEEITIILQVNGKVRGKITVPADSSDEVLREKALKDERIQKWLLGKKIKKVVVVQGRLVGIATE
jgi:leucyl-tRNA synthetase